MRHEIANPFGEAATSVLSNAAQYLPVMTLLCASLGVMFDIGFFYKLGFGMFTFFSISEHLLYALETAPVFLLLICVAYILGRFSAFLTRKGVAEGVLESVMHALVIVIFTGIIWFLRRDLSATVMGGAAAALWWVLGASISSISRVAFIVVLSFIVAFSLGIQYGINASDSPETLYRAETKNGIVYAGYPIRSGDRGVLFYDVRDSEFRFLGWDNINLISRVNK
jgi:hypothetical protein